jgi:colanic acid/amylovoran biosynthesis glycosyltransferase
MRIAYFTNQYPKVSHSFIRREIIALEKQGFDISRFALRGWDAALVDKDDIGEQTSTNYILKNGLLKFFLYSAKFFILSPLKFSSTLFLAIKLGFRSNKSVVLYVIYFLEACVLLGRMRKSYCQHAHAHFGTNPALVVMLAHQLGDISYSFTVHGPEEFDMPKFLHIKEKAKHAKFLIAVSSYGRSQLYRHIDYKDWPKVHVVHCGLEASFYDSTEKSIADTNRLVCVGRLCEQKGQLLLIEALHQLKEEGLPVELVLAGDGEMREILESLIRERGLKDSVRITGWISSEQVREEILNSRALVLPSFAEGLPVVLMESLALRRPVLTTYIAGIPELVVNEESGWLFPAGSVVALADAMKQCLNTPVEKLIRMGDTGYQRVVQRHDIDTEARKLAELFEEEG